MQKIKMNPKRLEKQVDQLASRSLKRITVEIPPELFLKIKTTCAERGVSLREAITEIFFREFN